MKAVRVRINEAENVRKKLLFEDKLDKTRKIINKNGFIEIPVKDEFESCGITLIEQDETEFYLPDEKLADKLDIPDSEKELLPSGWQILGDIIIITLHKDLEKYKNNIGLALLSLNPKCRTVLLDRGISGKMRLPEREVIAGVKDTITWHRENGCIFKIDAMHLMFSKGNLAEKKRMSKLGNGETIVDMFAGIGYFSIPMAVHSKPGKIIAIEINPVSNEYLKDNIRLNKVEDIVEVLPGDCSQLTPVGAADRVIMGYLDGHRYLQHGIRALAPCGMLHYHEAVPEAVERRPVERIIEEAGKPGRDVEIKDVRRIKKYAPGVWHVVVDARIS